MEAEPNIRSRELVPYACIVEKTKGRLFMEEESSTRTFFQRDRDRIIHSAAFRRLEYKTQVFVNHEGDYYRTRLTHSLEVAQLARSISRELGLDDDLAEATALAHDLGHTPFGHAGEDALAEVMEKYGGFDHNAQTIRIITKLEQRYANFDGLNLTWETLEGIAKHNGPLIKKGTYVKLPRAISEINEQWNLELDTWPSAEAQVAALADDIAYHNHDIDDGLRARLFRIEEVLEVPLVGSVFKTIMDAHPGIAKRRLVHEAIRRLINMMVVDVIRETRRRVNALKIKSISDIRHAETAIVTFSEEMGEYNRVLRKFLMDNMYRHHRVNRMSSKARRIMKELFRIFHEEPECLPDEWRAQTDGARTIKTAQVVCDYIAGMTDRYAINEYQKLFDISEKS